MRASRRALLPVMEDAMATGAQTTDRPWTVEDVQQLKTLALDGVSATIAALKMKRAEGDVRAKAAQLGISFKQP